MPDSSFPPLPVMPTVLLLEDNEAYRTLLSEILSLDGFEVCAVPDGRHVPEILATRRIDYRLSEEGSTAAPRK